MLILITLTSFVSNMQVKEVLYIRRKLFVTHGPIETIESEVIVVDDLVLIVWDSHGLHSYYKNLEHYMQHRFEYVVEDKERDVMIVDIGEC